VAITFYEEGTTSGIKNRNLLKKWLNGIILQEEASPGKISIIFSTDNHLLNLNRTYLSKDYITDIITFDYTENEIISGDLFISVKRVKENADKFNVSYGAELKRVMAHGILHLLGYDDKSNDLKSEMRRLEDNYLKTSPEI
jgi:rRNA maturation RNase YbeY